MLCGHRRPQVGEPARPYSSLLYICYCKHKTKIKGTKKWNYNTARTQRSPVQQPQDFAITVPINTTVRNTRPVLHIR